MTDRTKLIHRRLLGWYSKHQRNLPWRRTRDPYKILVAEVMLQQTQADRVIPKYRSWLKTWPTVAALARAPLHQVLRAWSGLGYNRRAVHLRQAARIIRHEHGGIVPDTITGLEALPGIGSYTARAIAAFAFRQRTGLIDTNVRRVVSRLQFGLGGPRTDRQLARAINRLVPTRATDTWHHALMDLGATVCVSRRPKCQVCPLRTVCRAYPRILEQPIRSAQPTVSFVDSDRFWRGRIVAVLLQQPRTSLKALPDRLATHGQLGSARLRRLVRDLATHGLVTRQGGYLKIPS